jgi:pyruvate formate lyase activating enzyme
MSSMEKARWWTKTEDGKIRCSLCPRECEIGESKSGFCYVRQNVNGELYTLAYSHPSALQIDPIEKKPLSHFFPGTNSLSIGTAGCNLGCKFCQNWDLSKAKTTQRRSVELPPEKAVELALEQGCHSLSYTYNEPIIWGEYLIEISRLAREQGLKNVMVTAGYITECAFDEVFEHIDAANVDLKAFTEKFYKEMTLSSLESVLNTLRMLKARTDVWVEITNLMIPTLNDCPDETREMCRWISGELGVDTPLHFTAFHPDYRVSDIPATPPATLRRASEIAKEEGLRYVYTGNVHDPAGQTTYCPGCGKAVIERNWHSVGALHLKSGHCKFCGQAIAGYFPENVERNGSGRIRVLPV